ncbi:hypothetical protein MMC25_007909 [Agyrium rufum]|nr:hypothetical protein [Agyrium rufum]
MWKIRRVLWEMLDVDWVLFVQDAGGIGFRSPSERLEILGTALTLLLDSVLDVNLKLAGNGKIFELLFSVVRKGEEQDPEELCASDVCTWLPSYEEGRNEGHLAQWEDFLRVMKMESETSQRGYMVIMESTELEQVWEREVARLGDT